MKEKLKILIDKCFKTDVDKIKKLASKKDVICFDLFDTLLLRNVNKPHDVFSIIEKKLNNRHPNFKKNRIDAEKKARECSKYEEVTLEEIYLQYPNIDKQEINELVKFEEKTELSLITINTRVLELYNYFIKQGKKVYIVSDTYFSKEFIIKLLNKNDIKNYTDLYLSSVYRLTKQSGNLFKLFQEKAKIAKDNAIHIGDNFRSDFLSAKRSGLSAIYLPKYNDEKVFTYPENDIEDIYLNSYIKNTEQVLNTKIDYYQRFGYERFGVFLFEYVKWIYNSLKSNNIKKVYFFSRDGLIMKKTFDIINKDKDIKSFYFEVSRRSLRVPTLHIDFSLDNLFSALPQSKTMSIDNFFSSIGLDINKYSKTLKKHNISFDSVYDFKSMKNKKEIIELVDDIKDDIISKSVEEFELFNKYVKDQNLHGKFAVVDIGWSGGMQRFLEQTLDKLKINHEVYGYYIGVDERYINNKLVNPNLNLNGYLFNFDKDKNSIDYRRSFVGLLETLFLEQNGSVLNYSIVNGKIKANRMNYEYIEDGKESYELKEIHKVQEYAIKFVQNAVNDQILYNRKMSSIDSFKGILSVGETPTLNDIKMFGNFRFFDDNLFNYLANPKFILYYIINPKGLKRDFLNSRWKIGFLKKLFKIKLPYKKMYDFLSKFK